MPTVVDSQGVARVLNWEPSPEDPRDFQFWRMPPAALQLAADPLSLPDFTDLDPRFPNDVTDQGPTGECTAHASLNDLEFLLEALGFLRRRYSHKAQYYLTRLEGGLPAGTDTGAYNRDTVKVLTKVGAILAEMHPDTTDFRTAPTTLAIADAGKRKALQYVSVPVSVNEIKASLAAGFPIIIGFRVPQAFMNTGANGLVSADMNLIPNAGHAVILVGYDDRPGSPTFGRFKIRNSWGKGWGAEGRGWILYSWLMALGADFWAITQAVGEKAVEPAPPPPPPAPKPQTLSLLNQPQNVRVGQEQVIGVSVFNDDGSLVQTGTVTGTPVGSVTYLAYRAQIVSGVAYFKLISSKPHPATENFRIRFSFPGVPEVESVSYVVSSDVVVPPPPPPPVGPRKAKKIIYDDGSVQDL